MKIEQKQKQKTKSVNQLHACLCGLNQFVKINFEILIPETQMRQCFYVFTLKKKKIKIITITIIMQRLF